VVLSVQRSSRTPVPPFQEAHCSVVSGLSSNFRSKTSDCPGSGKESYKMMSNLASLKNTLTNPVDHWRRKVTVLTIYETISPPSITPQPAKC
jgi:hypothetical protein